MTFSSSSSIFFLRKGSFRTTPTLRKATETTVKENIASIAVIAVGMLTLLGVLSKSMVDYFVGIRATRTSILLAADKAQSERTTLLEAYAEQNRASIDALEKQYIISERTLSSALYKIERLEATNALLIEQNTRLQEENKQLPILRCEVSKLQGRCAELETSVSKNSDIISHSGVMNN